MSDRGHAGASRSHRNARPGLLLVVAIIAIALASLPSHESFVDHVSATRSARESWAGRASSALRGVGASLFAETRSYLIVRVGWYGTDYFIGCLGCWLRVPFLFADPIGLCAHWFCNHSGIRWGPHEAFAVLCLVVFALWHTVQPGTMWRHFTTSYTALRSGRVWTLLTSAISQRHPLHLLHNLISLFAVAPQLSAHVPCEDLAELIILSALASSCVSVLWSYLARRHASPSMGASGVVHALSAARAAHAPTLRCLIYGVEMPASHAVLAQIGLDCVLASCTSDANSHEVDVAGHIGGATCGWWFARTRWRRSLVRYSWF